jgi:membrane protease YdiL (CAAX protease family)
MNKGAHAAFAAAAAGVLAAYNNTGAERPSRQRWYPVTNLGATGVLLAAASASGLSAADLGLTPGRVPAGLRCAAGPAGALAAAWLTLAAAPATRPLLADRRITGLTWPQLAYQVTVRIPVGTVLWEETAFRGVLQAALRRVLPAPAAIAVTSGVFGIWHIRPTMAALRINGMDPGSRAGWAGVAGAVAGTAVIGGILSEFREHSGSLAAPVLLHLTANCGAALAARAVLHARRVPAGR